MGAGDFRRVVPYGLGPDRVVQDDVSRLGLRRRHAMRYGGMPDVVGLLRSVPKGATQVAHWEWVDGGGDGHMMLVWREE